MAENINMSFVPNKNASVESRLGDAEDALALLMDRTEYCFGNLIEDNAKTEQTIKESGRTVNDLQRQVTVVVQNEGEDTGAVGKFANDAKTSEIFNDYTNNAAKGRYQHVEGTANTGGVNGYCAHLEGNRNSADNGSCSHVEGQYNVSIGTSNHIEGESNTIESIGNTCHIEGEHNHSNAGTINHIEGYLNNVSGNTCHMEGSDNEINGGTNNHVEGWKNTVFGNHNHAENEANTISGNNNHASGYDNSISGDWCAVFGRGNNINNDCNTVFGKFNVNKNLPLCVGIGTSRTNRKNGIELDWDGNLTVAGRVLGNAFDLYCSLIDESTVIAVPAGRKNVLIEVWHNPNGSGEAGFYDCCAFALPLSAESAVIYQSGDISVTCRADESGAVVLNSTAQGVKYKAMFYN